MSLRALPQHVSKVQEGICHLLDESLQIPSSTSAPSDNGNSGLGSDFLNKQVRHPEQSGWQPNELQALA